MDDGDVSGILTNGVLQPRVRYKLLSKTQGADWQPPPQGGGGPGSRAPKIKKKPGKVGHQPS